MKIFFFFKSNFFRPSTLKTEIFGQAMCIQRNRLIPFSKWVMGGGKLPMDERVKQISYTIGMKLAQKISKIFFIGFLFAEINKIVNLDNHDQQQYTKPNIVVDGQIDTPPRVAPPPKKCFNLGFNESYFLKNCNSPNNIFISRNTVAKM